jgi:ATP-dependent RNA helicase SUPV3L1/SUV3
MRALSTSQVKQIAGRAGRYGLLHDPSPEFKHGAPNTSSPGGSVTTLHQSDLPFIGEALSAPIQPLCYARLGIRLETFTALVHTLPAGAPTFTVYEAHIYAGCIGDNYRYAMPNHEELEGMCELVDGQVKAPTGGEVDLEKTRSLTIDERSLLCLAPIPWRDPHSNKTMKRLLEMYRKSLKVDLSAAVQGQGFMEAVEGIESHEAAPDEQKNPKRRQPKKGMGAVGNFNQQTLVLLETFHKVISLYLWMSYRNPASWVKRDEVIELKLRVEHALERCLEGLSRKVDDAGVLKESQFKGSGPSKPYLKKLAFGST